MNRRESLKALGITTLSAGLLIDACKPKDKEASVPAGAESKDVQPGRQEFETALEKKLNAEKFFTDHEIKQAKHMQETFASIMHAMGAIVLGGPAGPEVNYGLDAPGRIIHEVGTARMGDDPKKSVLNKWSQSHECKNLFVTDGSSFVQQGDKNPTWTILALSMRTAEYILEQKSKLNV